MPPFVLVLITIAKAWLRTLREDTDDGPIIGSLSVAQTGTTAQLAYPAAAAQGGDATELQAVAPISWWKDGQAQIVGSSIITNLLGKQLGNNPIKQNAIILIGSLKARAIVLRSWRALVPLTDAAGTAILGTITARNPADTAVTIQVTNTEIAIEDWLYVEVLENCNGAPNLKYGGLRLKIQNGTAMFVNNTDGEPTATPNPDVTVETAGSGVQDAENFFLTAPPV